MHKTIVLDIKLIRYAVSGDAESASARREEGEGFWEHGTIQIELPFENLFPSKP
jgi:hypothetical protein